MKNNLYIRTDGSPDIGLGHLVRCIALAKMLVENFNIHFACKQIPESIVDEIKNTGFSFLQLENDDELLTFLSAKDLVLIDSYEIGTDYQIAIKKLGCTLISIDDLHEKPTYADLILNHTPCVSVTEYAAQSYTQFALGPDYALLRPAFLELAQNRKAETSNDTVLICFGGSDSRNLSKTALEVVLDFDQFKNIRVITGAAYIHQESLETIVNEHANVVHYQNISAEDMAREMSEADLCIVPASGILTEALTSGAQIISGMYVDNQRFVFENYKKANAFISAENFSEENLYAAVKQYFSQGHLGDTSLVDGKSGERIKKLFRQLVTEQDFHLRKVTADDAGITFQWASDPLVRQYSLSKGTIRFEDHAAWLSRKLADPNCVFYIATFHNQFVGSIRFDMIENEAVISFLLDPNCQGKGFGPILLKKGILLLCQEQSQTVKQISGIIMPENISSWKTLDRFGFTKSMEGGNYKYIMHVNDENRSI